MIQSGMAGSLDHLDSRVDGMAELSSSLERELEVLKRWHKIKVFCNQRKQMGFELEFWIVDQHGQPLPLNTQFIQKFNSEQIVTEVHMAGLEINSNVYDISPSMFSEAENDLLALWQACVTHAQSQDAKLIMAGMLASAYPQHIQKQFQTPNPRYTQITDRLAQLRYNQKAMVDIAGKERFKQRVDGISMNGLTGSFQIHFRVPSSQFVRYYNASLILSGPLLAISGNAPYLLGKSVWEETRIASFERVMQIQNPMMHDTKPADFAKHYLHESWLEIVEENLKDFLPLLISDNNIESGFFHDTRLHNSATFRWSRLVLDRDEHGIPHVRIELRILPSGPTIRDMIANAAFYIGLLEALANHDCPLENVFSIESARKNFYRAAQYGLNCKIDWIDRQSYCADKLVSEELIQLSKAGLNRLGVDSSDINHYLSIIVGRAQSKQTGSIWQQAFVDRHQCHLSDMVLAYEFQQNTNCPVHLWALE